MTNLCKPTNTPWMTPYVMVTDVDKAIDFYQKAFGFEVKDKAPGKDGTTWHAELLYKGQLLMLGKAGAYEGVAHAPIVSGVTSPITLYLYTENVDDFYQHAVTAGANGVLPPDDMFWGDRMCQVKDIDGFAWCFATYKTRN